LAVDIINISANSQNTMEKIEKIIKKDKDINFYQEKIFQVMMYLKENKAANPSWLEFESICNATLCIHQDAGYKVGFSDGVNFIINAMKGD